MKMNVSFEIDGACFDQSKTPAGSELAPMFRRLADQIEGMDIGDLPGSRWAMYGDEGQNLGEARITE